MVVECFRSNLMCALRRTLAAYLVADREVDDIKRGDEEVMGLTSGETRQMPMDTKVCGQIW